MQGFILIGSKMGKTFTNKKLVTTQITMQEIWQHTMPKIEKSKKQYQRKPKHKNKSYED